MWFKKENYKVIRTYTVPWSYEDRGNEKSHMDIITLLENESGKRKVKWDGDLEITENQVVDIIDSWKHKSIDAEQCFALMSDIKGIKVI